MSAAPVIVRAALTADEWVALRRLALELRTPAAQLIADALRSAYPLTERKP